MKFSELKTGQEFKMKGGQNKLIKKGDSFAISENGLIKVGNNREVELWKK
jgi:hypothetical protein